MANLGNEVYDRVMDMVLKFISFFSCEKSGPVVTELFKFLHCVSELSSRVPEDQKYIFLSCVKNTLVRMRTAVSLRSRFKGKLRKRMYA